MITLKDWNKLSESKRHKIASAFYWNMSSEFIDGIAKEFHHNFNWKGEEGSYQEGHWYKLMLSNCTIMSNGQIKVTVYVS